MSKHIVTFLGNAKITHEALSKRISLHGRTIKSIIPDLGGVKDKPTPAALMRGYIGLSRAESADGVLIARPFSPLLFSQGPQPHASLLLDIMQKNDESPSHVNMRLLDLQKNRKQLWLKDKEWVLSLQTDAAPE